MWKSTILRTDREKDREKREWRDIRSILRRHERRRSIVVDIVPSSTRCSRPSTGWKQRITRRENRLTRLAIDPTGNLSRPSLLTRRANKGEIARPFRGIKYLGAIYLLRSFLSAPPSSCSRFFFLFLLPLSRRRRPDFTAEKRLLLVPEAIREGEFNRSEIFSRVMHCIVIDNTIKAIYFWDRQQEHIRYATIFEMLKQVKRE